MGQPHCRTCPFIDTHPKEGFTAGQEGLCRVLPDNWQKRRLDYDWCGSHPAINPEVPQPIHNALSRIHAQWGGSSTQAIAGSPATLNAGKVVWIVNVYPMTRSEQAAEELRADLGLLVGWARDHLFKEAKDPATPESDGA